MTASVASPDPQALKQRTAAVFDRSAASYDQVGVDFFTPATRDLVARAAVRAGERVLDLGAGLGAVAFAAAATVGSSGRVVSVDLSSKMAELAQADAGLRDAIQGALARAGLTGPEVTVRAMPSIGRHAQTGKVVRFQPLP